MIKMANLGYVYFITIRKQKTKKQQNKNLKSCKALILDEPNYLLSVCLAPEQSQSEKAGTRKRSHNWADKSQYKLTFTDQVILIHLTNQMAFPYSETIISELSHILQSSYFL